MNRVEYTKTTASAGVKLDAGPKISGSGKLTIGHGQTLNVTSLIDSLVTSDLPGDAINITSLAATSGATVLATDLYTAPASGIDTLTYKVANQYGQTATGTIAVTIDPGPTLSSSVPSLLTLGHSAVIGTVTPASSLTPRRSTW